MKTTNPSPITEMRASNCVFFPTKPRRLSSFFPTVLLLGFWAFSSVSASAPFHFSKYTRLKAQESFGIYETTGKRNRIGSGKLYILSAHKMQFHFSVKLPVYRLSATVRLRFLKKDKKSNYRILLEYVGMDNGLPRSAREIVTADAFLADHGILTLKFMQGKRFLQLSINRKGQNRLITEWGSVELRAE